MRRTSLLSTALIAGLLAPSFIQAQGILYVSNLNQTSTGTVAIGNDSWWAQVFSTGTNPDGYVLDSVQLQMGSSSGNPSGFDISVYGSSSLRPADNLGDLSGADPITSGISTFASSGITLQPTSYYFVVVTASTSISQGAFNWSMTSFPGTVAGWGIPNIGRYSSPDGASWTSAGRQDVFQLAIYATPVPEPTTGALLGLGLAALCLWRRRT